MKIYHVIECYDVDGGFGDAIPCEHPIATFMNREDADQFVSDWNDPHVYDKPYAELWCQDLIVQEIEVEDHYDKSEWKYESERREEGAFYHNGERV